MRAKYPTGYLQPIRSYSLLETFAEGFGEDWWCGIGEAGAAPFADVCVEGKLRNNQSFSLNIEQGAVHLTSLVLKDA